MTGFNGKVILANCSAGSGKSRYLLERVNEYIQQGVKPSEIGFVTYTKKGADVIQERIAKEHSRSLKAFKYFKTIHAICYHELHMRTNQVCKEQTLAQFRKMYHYEDTERIEDWIEGIPQLYKGKISCFPVLYNLQRDNIQAFHVLYEKEFKKGHIDPVRFTNYMKDYYNFKQEKHLYDFCDMLQHYIDEGQPLPVKIACIDEAQDLTLLQWQACFKAFANAEVIYICGDGAQSIFRHAGANPSVLYKLRAEQINLDTSYRCPSKIVSFAQSFRDLITDIPPLQCKSKKEGGNIQYINCMEDVLDKMQEKKESWLLLTRNNYMMLWYKQFCIQNLLPYYIKGKWMFSDLEILEWKLQRTALWSDKKRELAQRYADAGKFFPTGEFHINISTIHSVKGDEADNVVLIGDLLGQSYQALQNGENEEHCVWYVAATRAKENLYILRERTNKVYAPLYFDRGLI